MNELDWMIGHYIYTKKSKIYYKITDVQYFKSKSRGHDLDLVEVGNENKRCYCNIRSVCNLKYWDKKSDYIFYYKTMKKNKFNI